MLYCHILFPAVCQMVSRIDNVLGVICYYLFVAFPACHFSATQEALKAKRAENKYQ